jgi:hypothetical protein
MAFEEKRTWAYLFVTIVSYAIYLVIVLGRLHAASDVATVPYVETLIWTIGVSVLAAIVIHVGLTVASPEEADKPDERDRAIYHRTEYIGQSLTVLGGVGAMALALLEVPHFWIANALYLAFALSAVLGSVARIFAYRRGFTSW